MSKLKMGLGCFFCIGILAFQDPSSPDVPNGEMVVAKDSVVVIFSDSSLQTFRPKILSRIKADELNEIKPDLLEGFPTDLLSNPLSSGTVMPALQDALRLSTEYYCLVKGQPGQASATLFRASNGQQIWTLELNEPKSGQPVVPPLEGFFETNLALLATQVLGRCQELPQGSTVLVTAVEGDNMETSIQRALKRAVLEKGTYTLVNREDLETIGKEQLFSESPFVDPDKAVRMGNLVGARFVFMAKAERLVNLPGIFSIKCRLRIIDVETGEQKAEAYEARTVLHPLIWVVLACIAFLIFLFLLKSQNQNRQRSKDRQKVVQHQEDIQEIMSESKKWVPLIAARRKEFRNANQEKEVLQILELEKNLGTLVDHLGNSPLGSDGFAPKAENNRQINRRIKNEVASLSLLINDRSCTPTLYCQNIQNQIRIIEAILTEKH